MKAALFLVFVLASGVSLAASEIGIVDDQTGGDVGVLAPVGKPYGGPTPTRPCQLSGGCR